MGLNVEITRKMDFLGLEYIFDEMDIIIETCKNNINDDVHIRLWQSKYKFNPDNLPSFPQDAKQQVETILTFSDTESIDKLINSLNIIREYLSNKAI